MNANAPIDTATLATVTVTFNPEIPLLEAQLRALPPACNKIIVDNASTPEVAEKVKRLVEQIPNARLLYNDDNIGLAAAVNRGVRAVSELQPQLGFVLLLDQDSQPEPGCIDNLVAAFRTLEQRGEKVGCVGPLLLDAQTGLTHGFHQCTRWRWKRVYPPAGSATPVPCANLNGSGTLVRTELFLRLGGLEEPLFIDHVDTEWAFRVQAHRYSLWGVPNSVFSHQMGMASRRIWCMGWRLWPDRSPQRHYYLFRNAIILTRRAYVPLVWKTWAIAKLTVTAFVTLILGPSRCEQGTNMVSGIRDGCLHVYSGGGLKRS
jgi:rhamnosyltransferase